MNKTKTLVMAAVFTAVAAFTASVWAGGAIELPKSGQKSCWDTFGAPISCEGTGMDGETQVGKAWPEPRFDVDGDCVTDNLTGLTWAKNANLPDGPMPWQDALDWVAQMNKDGGLCGMSNWRLPTIIELGLMPNKEMADSATWLNGQGFENVTGYNYWSATTRANHLEHAWRVQMDYGYWLGSNKRVNAYVWPVSNGN